MTTPTTTPIPAITVNTGNHAVVPTTMQAIVQDTYGPAGDVLRLKEVPVPVPEVDEVVVRVQAASIHVGDLVAIEGQPIIARFATGLRKPSNPVPGTDVAGTVVAVGKGVTSPKVGDQVFGWCTGAFAEYARDRAVFGAKVLINGASGGLGSYAVQIATAFGAEVTGVCGRSNTDMVRSLGARHVIDYSKEDFTHGGQRYDFILDNVANHSLTQTRRALTERGVLQSNNGTSGGRWFGTLGTVIKTAVISTFTRRQAPPSIKFTNP